MIQAEEVKAMVEKTFPDAQVEVEDQTGTMDHFYISVASSVFQGKMLLAQHRMVQSAVQEALNDGRIHAIQIKTSVPK